MQHLSVKNNCTNMYCTKVSLEATLINKCLLLLIVPVITFNKSLLKF